MQAVLLRETGDTDVLRIEEVERPEPAEGEVLIAVRAASINPIDWKYRRGIMPKDLPAVLGNDVSGTVALSRADGFAEGDPVFGIATSGGYAQFATAPAALMAKKPDGLTHEQAAAIPVGGLTAWQAVFDRGGLRSGQSALINGAAGGVGHLAVQFAKRAGGRVIGTGSTRNRDFVLGLGADEYVDYTQQEVSESVSAMNLVLDTVGGDGTPALAGTLEAGGVLITITVEAPEREAAERGARAELLVMSPKSEQLAQIAELVAGGLVKVEIAQTMPLADVQKAHELSESGHTRGKIVLTLGD